VIKLNAFIKKNQQNQHSTRDVNSIQEPIKNV